MRITVTAILIFFCCLKLQAVNFKVTNNANNGPGSLRQAILDANANGSATSDLIVFEIPAVTVDDVFIVLTEALPNLSSNLVIDATTQSGAFLGSASIKVRLIKGSTEFFSGFTLDGITDVAIYGFYFSNFTSQRGVPSDDRKAGIFLNNCARIVIGAPGKQNGFGGNYTSIISPTALNTLENITISSNIMGLDPTGNAGNPNVIGIDLSYLSNSTIGGPTAAYGNIITANTNGGASLGALKNNVVFQHNVIGLDITRTKLFAYVDESVGVFANGEFVSLSILDNYIVNQDIGIRIDNITTKFTISRNYIGTGANEENFANKKYGMEFYNCRAGLVSENKIGYNPVGIYMDLTYPVSIFANSFFCNTQAMQSVKYPAGKTTTLSRITLIDANHASGTYLPNSTVELFYTDNCSADCQGKKYVTTVTTDANGNWTYNQPITGSLTSLGTNIDGATHPAFSKPYIDNASVQKTGVNCGQSTGTITVDVYDASIYKWYNRTTGMQVGDKRKLTGVPNGIYYLAAGNGEKCDVVSDDFTIDANTNGINDVRMEKNETYCGSKTGYIRNITVTNDLPRTWYRVGGGVVSTDRDLENVFAGSYYSKFDQGTCELTSKTYTIEDKTITYSIAPNQFKVTDATCGENNGRIAILGYQTKPDAIKWIDEQNNEFAATQEVQNLAPGKYRLVGYSNTNPCTNTLGEFTIHQIPMPYVDLSGLQKLIGCDGKTASTLGVNVQGSTGPYAYAWLQMDGKIYSDKLNLTGVPLGTYRLRVTDKYNCVTEGEWIDFKAEEATVLKFPNSFTPNGDGQNDIWEISGIVNYPFADFSIYNRSGTRVFYSVGYKMPFDGTFNGTKLHTGVYYYVIDLKTNCDKLSGSLTIIR